MATRVFNEGWRDQYNRMKRSGYRFNAPHQTAADYDDDFYHAVQDTWHLKDWIAADATLGPLGPSIANEAGTIPVFDIIADLANCTKHLILTRTIRSGGELKSASSTVSLHDEAMDRTIVVGMQDGSEYIDVVLLLDAHDAWENLLAKHGLL